MDRERHVPEGDVVITHDVELSEAARMVQSASDRTQAERTDLVRREAERDAYLSGDVASGGIWVVFDSDWREPPGVVVATFTTEPEALDYAHGPGDGSGWLVFHVPAPGWVRA
jgi:hypothetical protein